MGNVDPRIQVIGGSNRSLPREGTLYKVVRRLRDSDRRVSALARRTKFALPYAAGARTTPRFGRLFAAPTVEIACDFADMHRHTLRASRPDTFEIWCARAMISALQPSWIVVPAPATDPDEGYDYDYWFQLPTEAYRAYWHEYEALGKDAVMTRTRLMRAMGISKTEYVRPPSRLAGIMCDWIEPIERLEVWHWNGRSA